MKLVEVRMRDIEHDNSGWTDIAETLRQKGQRYKAVGWLVRKTRRYVLIAPVMHGDERSSFCTYRIPRGAVTSITRLRR